MKWAILFLFVTTQVKADYFDYTLLLEPELLWKIDGTDSHPDLKSICSDMKYNYIEENRALKELKVELKKAIELPLDDQQALNIKSIKKAIQERASHLIHLARPEWNSEIVDFEVQWLLPKDFEPQIHRIRSYEVLGVYYKGERSGQSMKKFSAQFKYHPLPNQIPYSYFEYSSKGTFLEICQFIPTLEFEIEALIEFREFFPTILHGTQWFFLRGHAP